MNTPIGVAVIGAGMAGRAHAHGYSTAASVFDTDLPPIRTVSVADINADFAQRTARRYGYARADDSWQAVVDADDVDAVSVVVANPLHREIVEALVAAGKHVLCEKPLAPTTADARAMAAAAEQAGTLGRVGFTFRRSPAIAAIKEHIDSGRLGRVLHFSGQYWADYGCDPEAPISWRYRGEHGSGALADIGSHLVDVGEFLCGRTRTVSGTTMATHITQRPVPLGAVVGHAKAAVGEEREPVGNDDVASFAVGYDSSATGTLSVSRLAHGHPNTLKFEVLCERGAVYFDLRRPAEFGIVDEAPSSSVNGYRQVLVGPEHPYIAGGLPMDFPSVGFGVNDTFVFQTRAFLDEIAGRSGIPACASFSEGVHNLEVLDAVAASATKDGARVAVP